MFRRAREVKRSRCCAFAHDALSLYSIPTKRSQASVSLFSPANNPLPSCTHCTCSRIIAHSCFISVCSPWSKPMGNYLSYSCRHGRNACQSPPWLWPQHTCSTSSDGAPLRSSTPGKRPGSAGAHLSHPVQASFCAISRRKAWTRRCRCILVRRAKLAPLLT
jgi:hypothetical protein